MASKRKKTTPAVDPVEDDIIDSDIESDSAPDHSESESDPDETTQGKKLRLAKNYLQVLENEEIRKEDRDDNFNDPIAHRLEQDVLEQSGKLQRRIAGLICPLKVDHTLKGHRFSPTCVTSTDKWAFSGSKDGLIVKWCIKTGAKLGSWKHNSKKAILAISVSTDGTLLATGGEDKLVMVWDADTLELKKIFRGHRGAVTALSFRKNDTSLLISGSKDRCVKLWNCTEMVYIETLYGHQDVITDIDSFVRERAITVGCRDRSLRLWKIPEESQLIYNGHKNSIDCVSMLTEEYFVTGADDCSICVWHINKKKPQISYHRAHVGADKERCWISAIAGIKNTECFITGSSDGKVKVWACGETFRTLELIQEVDVCGTVNSISVSPDQSHIVLAVGQEHRSGRWWSNKEARNRVMIVNLSTESVDR